ncbi:MAG: hypothetical protein AAFU77_01505 [Myxococcota bacterium]
MRVSLLFALSAACAQTQSANPAAVSPKPVSLGGAFTAITALEFSPEGELFVADSGSGIIHALVPPEASNPAAGAPYNFKNLDAAIASALGTSADAIRVQDLAIHPKSKEAYIAVLRAGSSSYESTVMVVNQTGQVRMLEPTLKTTAARVPATPAEGFSFYDEVPARSLTFTDLEYYQGRLLVAGLSNADFASSLWSLATPLSDSVDTTTVEIYHAVHNQRETRAPIRAMKVVELNDEPYLVAAYTCTPLVAFPLSKLVDGAHVTGMTIGELGYGNTPADMLAFTGQDMEQKPFPVVFMTHKNQSAQVLPLQGLANAVKGPGLAEPVMMMSKVDLGASEVPITGVLHIADQNENMLVGLRRDAEEGDLELVTFLKNVYFRLTDFQSEYEIPGYVYGPEAEQIKQFQNTMKQAENKPEFVRE